MDIGIINSSTMIWSLLSGEKRRPAFRFLQKYITNSSKTQKASVAKALRFIPIGDRFVSITDFMWEILHKSKSLTTEELVHLVKVLPMQTWEPEFDSQDPHNAPDTAAHNQSTPVVKERQTGESLHSAWSMAHSSTNASGGGKVEGKNQLFRVAFWPSNMWHTWNCTHSKIEC